VVLRYAVQLCYVATPCVIAYSFAQKHKKRAGVLQAMGGAKSLVPRVEQMLLSRAQAGDEATQGVLPTDSTLLIEFLMGRDGVDFHSDEEGGRNGSRIRLHHTFRSQLATDILHCLDADDASNQVTKQGTLGLSKPGVQLSSQKANALKNRPDLHPLCKLEVVEAAAKEKKRKVSVLRAAFFGVGQILTPLSVLLRTTSVPARRSTRCKNRKTPPTWSGSKHTAAPLLLLFVGMYSYSNACVDCHVRLCKGEPNVSARSELVTWKRRKQRTSHARVLPKLSEASIPLRAHHCWRRSIRRSLTPV
jgi:hypothetical protein